MMVQLAALPGVRARRRVAGLLGGVAPVVPAHVVVAAAVLAAVGVPVLSVGATPATAQEARVSMEVDTTVIHVGDAVGVRLYVDHPANWTVQWADSLDLAPFEVLGYEVAEPGAPGAGAGNAVRSTASLAITSFELGEQELPSIAVAVAAPDGTVRTLLTDPFRIGVESIGLDESGEIRDIKGPLSISRNWWTLLPWLLLVAALAWGALHLHRRRRARPAFVAARPAPPPRPFHLVALEALDELERSALLERGHIKTYHVRVSEIIRSYVEGQLEVPALEMTTGEVADGMRGAALGHAITESFRTFLDRCDLVKFAKLRPGVDDSREAMGMARSLVGMTSGGRTTDPEEGDSGPPAPHRRDPAASMPAARGGAR